MTVSVGLGDGFQDVDAGTHPRAPERLTGREGSQRGLWSRGFRARTVPYKRALPSLCHLGLVFSPFLFSALKV